MGRTLRREELPLSWGITLLLLLIDIFVNAEVEPVIIKVCLLSYHEKYLIPKLVTGFTFLLRERDAVFCSRSTLRRQFAKWIWFH